jgi:uncharacterized protein YfaS (alpha-2-macroglobulin family)
MWVVAAHAQVNRWDEVLRLEQQSLPASALEVVNEIYQEALNKGNPPELFKALLYQLKYETAIDADVLPDRLHAIEALVDRVADPAGQAVLCALLAELYADYQDAHRYDISQRTDGPGDAPEDLREWTPRTYREKIEELTLRSLTPVAALQETQTALYADILTEEKAAPELCPTLYDFVMHQSIQTLNRFYQAEYYPRIMGLYVQWLLFRRSQADTSESDALCFLMIELERAEFIRQRAPSGDVDAEYLQLLSDLERQYAGQPLCVEILYRKADYYYRRNAGAPDDDDASIEKAYALCTEGLQAYPAYPRIGLLQNLLDEMTESRLSVSSDNAVYPNENLKLKLIYRNVRRLTVEIYRIYAPISAYGRWETGEAYKTSGRLVETHSVELDNVAPYRSVDTLLCLPMKDLGGYEYVIRDEAGRMEPLNRYFSVSRLATFARVIDGQVEYVVVDRMTGKPIEGAHIRLYTGEDQSAQRSEQVQTDANGAAVSSAGRFASYQAVFQTDTALARSPLPWNAPYREPATAVRLNLFTDRSIYRPGQTLYFKGIAYEEGKSVVPNRTYTLFFRDANNKEIAQQQLKTNAFGSFTGEFLLPKGGLNGMFSLRSDAAGGYVSVRVEEYKRPGFDIRFDPNTAAYRFGDTLTVEGNAQTFAGVRLQETEVRYRITRQYHWMFRSFYAPPVVVAEGSVQTQSDGRFTLRFPADRAQEDRRRTNVNYTYSIEATLTAPNGETQTATTRLSVGDRSMYLSVTGLSDVLDKDSTLAPITLRALNLSGQPVAAEGFYELYSLKSPDNSLLDADRSHPADRQWMLHRRIARHAFAAGRPLDPKVFHTLPSGIYRLIAKAPDAHGDEATTEIDFTLASSSDKRPPLPVYEWMMKKQTVCAVGEQAQIIYGSSAKNVYVLFELLKDNRKLASSRFVLNNENRRIDIPFLESYGDGLVASFIFIKDGKRFDEIIPITRKQEEKTLDLRMEVFRDHLLPGQEETWTLAVRDAAQHPAVAEVLAAMYDASLDKLYPHRWSFHPVPARALWQPYTTYGNEFASSYDNVYQERPPVDLPDLRFADFNRFGFVFPANRLLLSGRLAGAATPATEEKVYVRGMFSSDDRNTASLAFKEAESSVAPDTETAEAAEDAVPSLRQNLNETAFFFPQLKTNEAGETLLSFTVPESNTTWQFLGLAHTPDLHFGQIAQQAVSRKPLMVAPNLPRFLRAGDRATLLSGISNLSEQAQDGTATLELFDPATNRTLRTLSAPTLPFSVLPGQTVSVGWSFEVPDSLDLVGIRITAASADFSDGEQHLLPLLPRRMLVTESLSLDLKGKETRTFPLAPLFGKSSDTREDYRTLLELTGNPTWYAVQALPSLAAPQTDNVLSWFATYYMNEMAARIARRSPDIRAIIARWNQASGPAETLLSSLEKNEELKSIVLEETPWVLEAENESAQKQRLATLFDPNRLSYGTAQALEKLQALQTADGGWAWYPGLPASLSITQWMLYRMATLRPDTLDAMTEKALRFIDTRFREHFERFRKDSARSESPALATYELEYLLVRSCYPSLPADGNDAAIRFYTQLLARRWSHLPDLYQRAIAVLILHRDGQTKVAQALLRSLREHATRSPDRGMYWANNHTRSFMTQSAVCLHTFLMEAFREAGAAAAEMNEMKRWLLQQKQTQMWESVPATVNAIDLLLRTGDNWLTSVGTLTAHLDGQPLALPTPEAGTAYVKAPQDPAAFRAAHTLTLTKDDDGPAWGALYRQYFEDLDRIIPATATATGLSLSKSLLTPADRPMRVGDKITIRLTVRTDRDLEFVHLKDLRAACLEPVEPLSGVQAQQGLLFYRSVRDASMNFFFPSLPRGVRIFEYEVYVTAPGEYSGGMATVQCLYAPEWVAHTGGERLRVGTP